MAKKNLQKLELTWIGKGDEPKLEPRILIEQPEHSYGDPNTENKIIHGDNLLALKALEQEYAGKVKCIYIDPPYNTGNAFEHYDDGLEHSQWLNLMKPRLTLLYKLLALDGVLFVNIDENEHAYLRVMLDEIFGRDNFIGDLIWRKRKGGGNDSRFVALDHDYIILFAKNIRKEVHGSKWRVSQTEGYLKRYKELDENGKRFYWDTLARNGLQNPIKIKIKCPDGTILSFNSQKSLNTINEGLIKGTVRFTKNKKGWSMHHKVYMPKGQVLRSILDNVGTNKVAKDETVSLFGKKHSFDYPKPEGLIKILLELVTNPGDLVLDSFLGSGTTAAVAHKMGRRYIGIELGDHAYTHCYPRMKQVVDGEQGGISKAVKWQGGGGFKFYELAPSLLQKDKYGNWVIDEQYNADMLAAAMAKQEGFEYAPDGTKYWKQGKSTEKDSIYTTTQFVTVETLDKIHDEMNPDESLLICCKAFSAACKSRYENITIKKIPQMLLGRCEFGKDDYSLNIIDMPFDRPEAEAITEKTSIQELNTIERKKNSSQGTLFD